MSGRWTLLLSMLALGCVYPKQVYESIQETEATIQEATERFGQACAPQEVALAEAQAAFARLELIQGNPRRANEHLLEATAAAENANERSRSCGAMDRDGDSVPDIVDLCPEEPEDLDGTQDEDGCPDVNPYGDEDGDGIINIDDACPGQPEDFDGHNDTDGCPETSQDNDGDGIIDAYDECPLQPEDLDGYRDSDGCPDPDNDLDGVPDIHDPCPVDAEDTDDFQDDDGCPDPDNDGDSILDINDACPLEPGVAQNAGCPPEDTDGDGVGDAADRCPTEREIINDYLDEDGCPDIPPARVRVTKTRVEIDDTIEFATGSAELLASAFPILNDVGKVLVDAKWIKLRIEGHTDNQGSDESNMTLSEDRAASVRAYVIRMGIDGGRLTFEGFGETRPLDTNRTPSGRARNRRVEFHIVD